MSETPSTDAKALAAKLLVNARVPSQATQRLYCFPYAGGGSGIYRDWAQPLATVARVVAVKPPGRESRFAEPALESVASLARETVLALSAQDDGLPFAMFGHSLGALVAFETTRLLRREGRPLPRVLVVSGCAAPTARQPEPISHLPHDEFIAEVGAMEGTPREVLENAELMELLVPLLRADFRASETYARSEGEPLALPLFAYGGTDDEDVPRAALDAWSAETTGATVVRMFAGGHFFQQSRREQVLAQLVRDLSY